jgi:uncharacterized membrane protein
MADWLEHTVQVQVPIAIDRVWTLWENIELMPNWMKWIESVTIQPDNPELSVWKLASGSFQFTWQSKITRQVKNQIIQWESVSGLPNRGAIRFYDRGPDGSIVKLTVSYSVPAIVQQVMVGLSLGKIVEGSLQADMERFKNYALTHPEATHPEA